MPTAEETRNKAVLRSFHAAMSSGEQALISQAIDEAVAPDVVIRTPLPVTSTGPEALKEVFLHLNRAFPDLRIAVEDMVAEGDKVVCRNSVTGTHRGEYLGVPATGKSITYDEIFIFRLAEGRIVETWGVVDVAAQLRQLGRIPAG